MTYWDHIEATYHPPKEHHPGTCKGCVLSSPLWGMSTKTSIERLANTMRVIALRKLRDDARKRRA